MRNTGGRCAVVRRLRGVLLAGAAGDDVSDLPLAVEGSDSAARQRSPSSRDHPDRPVPAC